VVALYDYLYFANQKACTFYLLTYRPMCKLTVYVFSGTIRSYRTRYCLQLIQSTICYYEHWVVCLLSD